MTATYHIHGDLSHLLRQRWRARNPIVLPVTRSTSIKDAIEAFGLPHTEIGSLSCNGSMIDFSKRVEDNDRFAIYPITAPWDIAQPTLLRPAWLHEVRFIVDVNVGRLARYLRMTGFDTLYNPCWTDREILLSLENDPRILLTRNLDLLKRKQIVYGRCIRATAPADQLREVLHLYNLTGQKQPFSRCLDCNAPLQPAKKQDILHRLEPLTIRYFDVFSLCPHCDKIYWSGSHVDRMQGTLRSVPPLSLPSGSRSTG